VARIAWTCGLPGLSALENSTPACAAICEGVPPIHCWKTSLTRAACPAGVLTGCAHRGGYPDLVTSRAEPVYRWQFAAVLSSPFSTSGAPLELVRVAPLMMSLIARAATWRLSIGLAAL
jgi:hypothetical protein